MERQQVIENIRTILRRCEEKGKIEKKVINLENMVINKHENNDLEKQERYIRMMDKYKQKDITKIY